MFRKASSYGLSLENALADGLFLAGLQVLLFGAEFVKKIW